MSITIELSSVSDELLQALSEEIIIKPPITTYNPTPELISCFSIDREEGTMTIPMCFRSLHRDFFSEPSNDRHIVANPNWRCKKKLYTTKQPAPVGTVLDPKGSRDQDDVVAEALDQLERNRVVFISASPGAGKTSMAAYVAAKFKLKTLVLCHITKVLDQWVKEFETWSNATVQRVTASKGLDPNAEVYVCGVMTAKKIPREEFAEIGLVIVDEAHIATKTLFSEVLLKVQPKYLIGLSATPRRADGLQKLLTVWFGPSKGFVHRHEVKDFVVYKIETPYRPTIKYQIRYGKPPSPDWNVVINSIAYNEERQNYVVGLTQQHPDHRIMVMSDRIEECSAIYDKLVELGEDPVFLAGTSKKKMDTTKHRILVAGRKKAGTGFDDPGLTMLVLCTTCKMVNQFEGRIRTTNNIIYDLVDDYRTFETHWRLRKTWYESRGADVKVISLRASSGEVVERVPIKNLNPKK
jgi:superfamily II DNA or RNA helicase